MHRDDMAWPRTFPHIAAHASPIPSAFVYSASYAAAGSFAP